MEENQSGAQKSIWKTLALVLGVVLALMVIGVAVLFIRGGKSGNASADMEVEKTELKVIVPAEKETKISAVITVTRDGAAEDEKEDKTEDKADAKKAAEYAYSESHRYEVVSERKTWSEAQAACEEKGGYLATVTNEEEFKKVLEVAEASDRKVLWLGAKRESDNNFAWITKETFSYTSWLSGEPNNEGGNENYLVMFLVNDQWVWADVPEDLSPYYSEAQVGYICEYNE